jgi:hypothetical protein
MPVRRLPAGHGRRRRRRTGLVSSVSSGGFTLFCLVVPSPEFLFLLFFSLLLRVNGMARWPALFFILEKEIILIPENEW